MFGLRFGSVDDAALVAVIDDGARAEAAAAARRLAAIAELTARHTEPDDQRRHFAIDGWACAAAEIAAAMGISQRAASREMRIAMALREQLPRVAALFAAGRISAALVAVITWRTALIVDAAIAARVDAVIAERAHKWGALSKTKLDDAIDTIVDAHDPDARRRLRQAMRGRDLQVGKPDDETGTVTVFGLLTAADGALLDRRLAQMAAEVCQADPRTVGQRRSDAAGVIAAGGQALTCHCGQPDCPAAGADPRARAFVINILADQGALTTPPDPHLSGQGPTPPIDLDTPAPDSQAPAAPDSPPAAPAAAAASRPQTPAATPAAAVLLGGGVIPTPLLAELIKGGAAVRSVTTPDPEAQPGYRLSPRRERFVRMRDMTCRFPGCERPAECCDVDHTIAYPAGATHPSNTKCLCRLHHLLKTFCGWQDHQLPDGTIVWTAPSGRTYTTYPGSRMLFPHWDTTTAALPPVTGVAHHCDNTRGDKTLKMPRRRRTRTQTDLARINAERAHNAQQHAINGTAPTRPPPPEAIHTTDPPPF